MIKTTRKLIPNFSPKFLLIVIIFLASMLFAGSTLREQSDDVPSANANNNVIEIRDSKEQPFFPFGFYYASFDPSKRMEALRDIGEAGFNTMFNFWQNLKDYEAFLDEAKRLGVHVITELKGDDMTIVNKFKNKSAVFGWGIADDAGDHQDSDDLLELHNIVKAADPKHYTYVSVSNWSKKWAGYAHVADLIGGQSYPIGYPFDNRPENLPNDLSEVNYVFNIGYAEANKSHRPVIANLQTFSWKGQRWPTAHEVYNMTYQALLSGVKGIIFYTYDDTESRIRDNPDVWNMVKSLVPEIEKLSPVLLKGTFTSLKTQFKFKDLLAGQWTYEDSIYVVLVNTSRTKTRQVSLSLQLEATGTAKPLFPGRPSGMVFENGKLSGSIKPEDVHIYQLLKG